MERAGKGVEAVIGWMPPKSSIQTLFHFIEITPLHTLAQLTGTQKHTDNVQHTQEAVKELLAQVFFQNIQKDLTKSFASKLTAEEKNHNLLCQLLNSSQQSFSNPSNMKSQSKNKTKKQLYRFICSRASAKTSFYCFQLFSYLSATLFKTQCALKLFV